MRKIIKTSERYHEFVRKAKTCKWSKKSIKEGFKESHSTKQKDWYGTGSFQEAMDLATGGWDTGLAQLKIEEGVAVGNGMEFTPSIHGAVVNVGAYLSGQPETMFDLTEKREYNLEELTIYVPLSYSSNNSGKKALRFTDTIVDMVNDLQSKNNVRLIGVFDTQQDDGVRWINEVIIKDFDERFVLNNLAFSFHPSFFRRLWFKRLEAEEFISWGHGSSTHLGRIADRIRNDHTDKTKALILPQLDGLSSGAFGTSDCVKLNYE